MTQILSIPQIEHFLDSEGYKVFPRGLYDPTYWVKSCFDIAARKNFLLLIKIFMNIDKIPAVLIEDLKLISYFLDGIPIVIGNETRKTELREDVVYERRGIPAMNYKTFNHLIKNNKMYVISRKGGFFIRVDGEKIRQLRLEQDLSLQEVASRIGVSRKAVYLFERMEQIKEENVNELEDIFNESFKFPIDIFKWELNKEELPRPTEETDFQAEIKEYLEDLGFDIFWAKKAPFDGITSDFEENKLNPEESCLITGLSLSRRRRLNERIQLISDISKFARKLSMFIIEDQKVHPIENVLILQKAILEKMKDIQELQKKLKKIKRRFY